MIHWHQRLTGKGEGARQSPGQTAAPPRPAPHTWPQLRAGWLFPWGPRRVRGQGLQVHPGHSAGGGCGGRAGSEAGTELTDGSSFGAGV